MASKRYIHLGHAIIYQDGRRRASKGDPPTKTELHELVHVRQVEDRMLLALIIGAIVVAVTGNWILGLVLWWSGGMWQLPNFVASGIRHGWTLDGVYRESEHEKSARGQTSRKG